jgi:hypothetical protein
VKDPRHPDDFGISISLRDGVAHLRVTGHVDGAAGPTLEHLLARLPAADVTSIVVDLTSATEVSEPVMERVDASRRRLQRDGGSLQVMAAPVA